LLPVAGRTDAGTLTQFIYPDNGLAGGFPEKGYLKGKSGIDFHDKSVRDSLIDYIIGRFGGKDVLNN
jgi:hypothetical protein